MLGCGYRKDKTYPYPMILCEIYEITLIFKIYYGIDQVSGDGNRGGTWRIAIWDMISLLIYFPINKILPLSTNQCLILDDP